MDLREALEWFETRGARVASAAALAGLGTELERLMGAARSLLEARETLWCVAHSSTGATDPEGRGVCWFFMFAEALRVHAGSTTEHLPCRLVPARLVFEKEQK